ncbi:hypothetical protein EFV91_14425 [Yersinia enterocolitica]|nr:hypothetical protein [Yersinia enterocolitica]
MSPESLTYVSSSGLMSLVPEAPPSGSINAVQIGSRPICYSFAAWLQRQIALGSQTAGALDAAACCNNSR